MNKLRDCVAYLCAKYPYKQELSKARLTKMVYLCDWRSTLVRGTPITPIRWYFNHYGPYVSDVVEVARQDSAFRLETTTNVFGDAKQVVSVSADARWPSLTTNDIEVLEYIIKQTEMLSWNQFISLVYSTYPIRASERETYLDLGELAKIYDRTENNATGRSEEEAVTCQTVE